MPTIYAIIGAGLVCELYSCRLVCRHKDLAAAIACIIGLAIVFIGLMTAPIQTA